jgi:hypothetical protein
MMKYLTSIGISGLLALTFLTGCSSGSKTMVVPDPSATVGLPTPAAAGPVNTYLGAQAPGEWNFTLDNTNNKFSYQPITYSAAATTGTITATTNGFSVLSNGGLAFEVEGRAAMLRPGDSTNALVFGVPQTECYSLTGRLRFQYEDVRDNGYGTIVASTDSTGASWAFEDLAGDYVYGPASFTATCSTSNNLSTINFPSSSSYLDSYEFGTYHPAARDLLSNIWIGPTGFFVGDQSVSIGTVFPGSGGVTATIPYGSSVVGVSEPTAALSASDIASKNYIGFHAEPGVYQGQQLRQQPYTAPVSFTGLTGEAYTSADVTQALDPATAMTISLGKQDTTYNGYYPSATITALDPAQNCATAIANNGTTGITAGVNAEGYVTCTSSATVVVGKAEGRYALIVSGANWTTDTNGRVMILYLFQQ